ncbi:MAG: hypothetical protein FWF79_06140 [Defluviitaleaceae bacterium]|nr:hypothetical protein [Defluviitaleaceae bacterium]
MSNTLVLTKFILRREKYIALAWVALLALVIVGVVPVLEHAFFTGGSEEIAEMLSMPALVFMVGPNFAVESGNFGALYTTFMMLFTALTVGIMNIFLVVRYTRADEERGRYEVLRSLPLGRLANLNSTMITAVIVNAVLAVVIGLGMFAAGDESMYFQGSMLWGASLAATGLVFAAVAALFSQLSASSRGAVSYSFIILAAMYVLRAPGDMNMCVVCTCDYPAGVTAMEILSLISPLGLVLRTQAYVQNNWWPIWIMLATTAAITAIAFKINAMRDIDQGLIPARAGRSHGSFLMKTTFGLSFKLLRTSLICWIIGMFLLTASYGAVLGGLDDFIAQSEMYQQLMLGPVGVDIDALQELEPEARAAEMHSVVNAMGFTIPELFVGMITNIMGIFVTVPVILFALKVKAEEKDIRAESILATKVCRNKYLAGFVCLAFASAVIIQLAQAIGMHSAAAAMLDNPADLSLGFLVRANLAYVPALWTMIGFTVFLIGFMPNVVGAVWGFFGYSFLMMFFGRLGAFPDWLAWLSPFHHTPVLPLPPGESISIVTLSLLTAIAAALTICGFVFYNKRDINAITH